MSGFRNIQVLLGADSGNLKRGLAQGSAAVRAFDADIKSANASQSGLAQGLKMGLAAGAVAVAVGIGYAVTKAIEFDKAMRNTQSLTQQSDASFKQLEASVISMSTRLPQSAVTLAEGLYDIASSGFQGADGLMILESSAQAASAGLSTTAVSARAITGVLNAYGLQAADSAYVSDVLFQTVNLGVVSFDELAGSIGNVLGSAAAAKVSIAEVGASIATMTLAGIGGAEATTSLNNLITKIIQPSDALGNAFKKMGYETGEQALKANGLHGIMEKLRISTGGNITTMLQYFPEIRAARGALALMANEGKNYNKVSAQIDDKNKVAGATMKTLKVQMEGVGMQWTLFKNGIDAAAISLGVKILPVISDVLTGLKTMGPGISDVISKLSPFKDAAIAVGQALLAVGTFIGPVVGQLAKLAGTAAIGMLIVLAKTLEAGGKIIKDHAAIVTTLAIAYGVHLLAALLAAQGGIGLVLWYNAGLAMLALRGGVTSVTTALKGLVTMEALATLGVAAIITAGITAWNGYSDGADKAADATKAINDAVKQADFSTLKKAAADGLKSVTDANDKLQAQKDKGILKGMWDIGGNMNAIGLQNNIDGVVKGVDAATTKLNVMRGNTLRYLSDATGLTGQALTKAMSPVTDTMEHIDSAVVALSIRAKAAGVNLGDSYDTVKTKLDAYKKSTEGTAGAQQKVIDALGKMGSSASDTASQVDALNNALDQLLGIALGADAASDKFEGTLDKMTKTLKENGKTIDGTTEKGRANKEVIRAGVKDLQDKIIAEGKAGKSGAELSKMMLSGIDAMYRSGDAAGFSRGAMQELFNQYNLTPDIVSTIVEAIGAGKSADEIKAMIAAAAQAENRTVVVNAVGQVLSAQEIATLNDKIKGLQGKIVEAKQHGATESSAEVQKLRAQIAALTPKTVTVKEQEALASAARVVAMKAKIAELKDRLVTVKALGTPESSKEVQDLRAEIARLEGKTVTVHYGFTLDGKAPSINDFFHVKSAAAFGNIYQSYAAGGTRLPAAATIAKDGSNFVQWAEKGTGGEGFIPLAKSRRTRSTAILSQIAEMFGLSLQNAEGGDVQTFASGGIRRPTAKQRTAAVNRIKAAKLKAAKAKVAKAKAAAAAKAKAIAAAKARVVAAAAARAAALDAAQQRAADAAAIHRLDLTAAGYGDGAVGYNSDLSGLFGNVQSSLEARGSAAADARAARTSNQHDTGADYYTKPKASINDFSAGLANQLSAQQTWGAQLANIAATAGADVAASLEKMGDAGKDIVASMAGATTADMQRMADAMRGLEFNKFTESASTAMAGKTQFQANLIALVKMGKADLASKFADMGYDTASGLAASAVKQAPATLDLLNSNLNTASDADTASAIKLAGLLQGSSSALGVFGLSKASGIDVMAVIDMLQKYSTIFSAVGPKMNTVGNDLALINAGKQPSGLINGGIVPGGQQQGLYYKWAEKGGGGESLIPLGISQRVRARQLWHETGRMLGERSVNAGKQTIVVVQQQAKQQAPQAGPVFHITAPLDPIGTSKAVARRLALIGAV